MSISRRALFGLGALAVCGKARGQEPGFTDAEEIALGELPRHEDRSETSWAGALPVIAIGAHEVGRKPGWLSSQEKHAEKIE